MENAALKALDQLAVEMEHKWGTDRLVTLVGHELAARFEAQAALVDAAIGGGNPRTLTAACEAMIRAWNTLDVTAEAGAMLPMIRKVWTGKTPAGRVIALVRDDSGYHAAKATGAEVVFSFDEIGRLVDGMPELVLRAKEKLGGIIKEVKQEMDWTHGDDIPF